MTNDVVSGCPVTGMSKQFDPFSGEPYRVLQRARQEEPVFYAPEIGYWVVTRREDIKTILRDAETFSAANVIDLVKPLCPAALDPIIEHGVRIAPTLVDEDPPGHTPRRLALLQPFTPGKMKVLEPRIRQLVTEALNPIVDRGESDLVDDLLYEFPALVLFDLMGVPAEELDVVRTFCARLAVFGFGQPTDEQQVELAHGMAEYWDYAKQHIARLIEEPGDDVMSQFIEGLRTSKDGDLFDETYATTIMLQLLFAGHETTTNALAGGIRALLEDREQWEMLCAQPELIPNAVEECLRFAPSVPAWRRRTTRPVTIRGVPIPADANLLIHFGSANRDEDTFADGERFDIRRENAGDHFAFGWGRHHCIGAPVSRLEMRVCLEELTFRLPGLELAPGQQFQFSPNTSHRGPEHLLVRWAVG